MHQHGSVIGMLSCITANDTAIIPAVAMQIDSHTDQVEALCTAPAMPGCWSCAGGTLVDKGCLRYPAHSMGLAGSGVQGPM